MNIIFERWKQYLLHFKLPCYVLFIIWSKLADLTVSERPGTGFQIEIHFTVFNRFYLLFSCMKLVET